MLIKQTTEMTERERIAAENSNNQYLQALAHVAVGTIYPFVGETEPDTFMFCDGRALDVTKYAELFSVIGYTYGGSGDFFNLPDLRGKTLVGRNENDNDFSAVGKFGGKKEHTLTEEQMPSHGHYVISSADSARLVLNQSGVGNGSYAFANGRGNGYYSAWITDTRGGGQPHNNMPPYMIVNYIIKVIEKAPENYYSELVERAMEQINEAVEIAKSVEERANNGEFIGPQGPQGIQGPKGEQGLKGEKGDKGLDYILTDTDKQEIADIVLEHFIDVSEEGQ